MLVGPQVMSSCFNTFCAVSIKQNPKILIPTEIGSDRFSQLKLLLWQYFWYLNASTKEISLLQNLYNCSIEELLPNL